MSKDEIVLFCNTLSKDNVEEKIDFLLTKENYSYTESEINFIIIRVVEGLVETKKYELIEKVIGTKEKLKELMKLSPLKQEYLYHFYLASLSGNGKFEELVETFEEIRLREELRLYLEKIRFNVGRAYAKIENYSKAIEILEKNRNARSKLFIAYIYTLLEDDEALKVCKELQKSGFYLTCEEEARIYLTYAQYSLRKNNIDEAMNNIDKVLFFITGVKTGFKNVLFYEVAQIYKEIGNEERHIYCLKEAGQFSAEDEVQMYHKLKAIIELQSLETIKEVKITELLPHEKNSLQSDLVIELIKNVKGGIT